jgi:hypothetical protein
MVILCVRLEVFRQVIDSLAEEGDLNFRRARIRVVRAITADDFGLAVLAQHC